MITYSEFLEINEAIKTAYSYRYLNNDGEVVYVMPYKFETLEDLLKQASNDVKAFLKVGIKANQYITDKDKKVFIGGDDINP